MILTLDQIKDIVLHNPNAPLVKKGCDYNKVMRMHIYGDRLEHNLEQIKGFEDVNLRTLRVNYAKSNKDLFSRLSRPIDKVFSARGGSVYYNLPDATDKKARAMTADVKDGYSVRKWIEVFWRAHMLDDPFGLLFLELLPLQEAILAKQQGRSFVYPTYKAITSVFDYLPKGSALEYVFFTVDKAEKKREGFKDDVQVYRLIDDAVDCYVVREGETITVPKENVIPNYFGFVPALLNSDINNPETENCVLSLYDDIVELAKGFLIKGSIKVTHEFMHAFPKYWEYADTCNSCQGTRYQQGEVCKDCRGTGKAIMSKVSDVKLLEYPDKDTPKIAPDVAGYVSPDRVFWEIATADLQMLEDLMSLTLWGNQSKVKTQGPPAQGGASGNKSQPATATEIVDEMKPQADRLKPVSEMAEKRTKFIIDNVIRLNFNLFSYPGSSVNYGRRYMIEGPDTIWEKYSDARLRGAAVSVLDDLLVEYYETKYEADPIKLAIQKKLMKIEPFVHMTSLQTDMSASITVEDKAAKVYFGEWLSQQTEAYIMLTDANILREQLLEYSGRAAATLRADKLAEQQASNPNKAAA